MSPTSYQTAPSRDNEDGLYVRENRLSTANPEIIVPGGGGGQILVRGGEFLYKEALTNESIFGRDGNKAWR
jgi:hypothetical protein